MLRLLDLLTDVAHLPETAGLDGFHRKGRPRLHLELPELLYVDNALLCHRLIAALHRRWPLLNHVRDLWEAVKVLPVRRIVHRRNLLDLLGGEPER